MTFSESCLVDVCEFVLDGTHSSPERTENGIAVLGSKLAKLS